MPSANGFPPSTTQPRQFAALWSIPPFLICVPFLVRKSPERHPHFRHCPRRHRPRSTIARAAIACTGPIVVAAKHHHRTKSSDDTLPVSASRSTLQTGARYGNVGRSAMPVPCFRIHTPTLRSRTIPIDANAGANSASTTLLVAIAGDARPREAGMGMPGWLSQLSCLHWQFTRRS